MLIILYHNQSGHFTCFQVHVTLVVSLANNEVFDMKKSNMTNFSLESILSMTPGHVEYWNNTTLKPPSLSGDKHLIK